VGSARRNVSINVSTAEASATGIPPNIKTIKLKYLKSFIKYDDVFKELKELLEEDLSAEQDLLKFNIRIRINLALKPAFSNDYGYVKNINQKTLYSLLYKIADAWFVYENICAFKRGEKKSFYNTEVLLDDTEALELLSAFNVELKEQSANIVREKDLIKYLDHLFDVCSKSNLKSKLVSFKEKLKQKKSVGHNEIIASIYAVRNAFVHNSDTARAGVLYYKTKIDLLELMYDYLIEFMLLAVINVINKKIAQVE
jgi:hypothetical protein